MHHEDSSGRLISPLLLEDRQTQFVVLGFVADEAPITDGELERALALNLDCFGEVDDYRRAVSDLIASGLVRREGKQLWPTRATRCVAALGVLDG
jgi:hypothetical protein